MCSATGCCLRRRGIGANAALKDAMRLCAALTAASRGQRPVLEAIHDYEAGMIDYGFRAVRASLHAMNQAIIESRRRAPLARFLRGQGRNDEARERLARIFGSFKEGLDTIDLRESKALLDEQ